MSFLKIKLLNFSRFLPVVVFVLLLLSGPVPPAVVGVVARAVGVLVLGLVGALALQEAAARAGAARLRAAEGKISRVITRTLF